MGFRTNKYAPGVVFEGEPGEPYARVKNRPLPLVSWITGKPGVSVTLRAGRRIVTAKLTDRQAAFLAVCLKSRQ
jgi:hypothetical protein